MFLVLILLVKKNLIIRTLINLVFEIYKNNGFSPSHSENCMKRGTKIISFEKFKESN